MDKATEFEFDSFRSDDILIVPTIQGTRDQVRVQDHD